MSLRGMFGPLVDNDGFAVVPTDSAGYLPDDSLLTWQSQVEQYPDTGPHGIGYFGGVVTDDYTVDCLLYRSWQDGPVLGILNHYPADFKPWERAHNVNIWVDSHYQRTGIGTALLTEAMRRWPQIDLSKQRFTRAGRALAESFGPVKNSHAIATLRRVVKDRRPDPDRRYSLVLDAVADLLEVHDDTGINLAQAPGWAALVNDVLDEFGYAPVTSNGA